MLLPLVVLTPEFHILFCCCREAIFWTRFVTVVSKFFSFIIKVQAKKSKRDLKTRARSERSNKSLKPTPAQAADHMSYSTLLSSSREREGLGVTTKSSPAAKRVCNSGVKTLIPHQRILQLPLAYFDALFWMSSSRIQKKGLPAYS